MLHYIALLLPSFVCLFWAVTLLCSHRTNTRSQNIWIAAVFFMSISSFVFSYYFVGVADYTSYYKLDVVEAYSTVLFHTLFYFYFRSVIDDRPFAWYEYLWLFPTLLVGGGTTLLYIIMGNEAAISYVREMVVNRGTMHNLSTWSIPWWHYLISVKTYNLMIFLQVVYIIGYISVYFIRSRRLKGEYVQEGRTIERNRAIFTGLLILLFFSLLGTRGRFYYVAHPSLTTFLLVAWGVMIYYMSYNVYRINDRGEKELVLDLAGDEGATVVSADVLEEEGFVIEDSVGEVFQVNEALQVNGNVRITIAMPQLLITFRKMIDEEKVFLQKELRMEDLARRMCSNRTYISRLINEEFQCNFSDYINSKRVEYAQELMRQYPGLTQEQVADKSGFLHSSSFSRTFRQQTGVTFREWRKDNLQRG